MLQFDPRPYQTEDFQVRLEEGPDGEAVLRFLGTIEHPNPGVFLDPMLGELHEQALLQGTRRVVADFTELGFLNSSGIKSLIKWAMKLRTQPAEARYNVTFLYSTRITWQSSTLKSISAVAQGTVTAQAA